MANDVKPTKSLPPRTAKPERTSQPGEIEGRQTRVAPPLGLSAAQEEKVKKAAGPFYRKDD